MLASLLQWLAVMQILVPKLVVVSRTTFPPDLDLDVILGISPRTTTIDYDMADFDEQAFGPTYSSGTVEVKSSKGSTGTKTGNNGKSNKGISMRKFVMMRPDSNDNVDGPAISDMDESNNQISAEDNIVIEDTTGTVNADIDTSLNADPDVDADGVSTDDLNTKSDSMGSAEVTGKPARSSGMPPGSKEKSGSSKQGSSTPSPTNNATASEAKSSNLTFSSCFENNAPSSTAKSDFCKFANAVYGVCKARFSSKCRGSGSQAKDRSFMSSEEQMYEEADESYRFTSEESMDEENIGYSFESTDYDSLRASLESLGSADMSDNEINQVLKIVKSLCPNVCSAAKRKRQPGVTNSDSSAESTDTSVDSAESSAHSSVTQETSEEASDEVISSESDGTISKAGRNSSKTNNSARNYKKKSPRKSRKNRRKKKPYYSRMNSERDFENESDSD